MNAYTARSLYDEDDEEDDEEVERTGGVGLTVSHQPGEVYNDSPTQVIIVALYGIKDTLQVAHVEKQKILPNSSCIFSCLQESSKYPLPEYNLHIRE